MEKIIINPGSGKCINATLKNAQENMRYFVLDIGLKNVEIIRHEELDYDKEYSDGRFAFILKRENQCTEIQMPGLPLSHVRFMNNENQNIWNFPRLYVDGSSWVWCFALGIARKNLVQEVEE